MTKLGIVGAGTMGAGIAQVAAQRGLDVLLLDVEERLVEGAIQRVRASLDRATERGRLSAREAQAALERLSGAGSFSDLHSVDWAIEAVPEEIGVKREVLWQLDQHCPVRASLATNTSSLSVSEIAAATQRPDRVVGLHFFNPPTAMALVEVVRASHTSMETVERAVALVRELGKTPVCVADVPGFIVNRVIRPFYNEALRILADGIATPEQIDRIMRGVGFRMGPFELMDLIGNDVNLAVTTSIYEQLYGEARLRPSPLQRRLVQGGDLGQKTGRGWYGYGESASRPTGVPESRGETRPFGGPVAVIADSALGVELADGLRAAGSEARLGRPGDGPWQRELQGIAMVVDATVGVAEAKGRLMGEIEQCLPQGVPIASLALIAGTTEIASGCAAPGRVCGFGYLPPLGDAGVLEVAPGLRTEPEARQAVEALARSLGKEPVVVQDSPGLVAGRIVCLIINEAAFAVTEGVAEEADIDIAVRLGANYPRGPLEWADLLGLDLVYGIIKGMEREFGEDRYRASPLLGKMVLAGWTGRSAGRGFFKY